MDKEKSLIKICSGHQNMKTALIWTFAFPGAEYWCPHCGYLGGVLGSGKNVPLTKTLQAKLEIYKKLSGKYLKANGLLNCSYFKYKGGRREFSEMSMNFQTYWINQSKKWDYKI